MTDTLDIGTLKDSGEDRFDPVRFRYIEAMLRRASQHSEPAATVITKKAAQALTAYRADLTSAQLKASATVERVSDQFPDSAAPLQALLQAQEFDQIERLQARLLRTSEAPDITVLTRHISQLSELEGSDPQESAATGQPQELKSLRQFRDTLAQRKAEQLVARSVSEAPEDSGPLNPHKLVTQSLEIMRDLSPQYLNHFVTYIDTLLWLEQAREDS